MTSEELPVVVMTIVGVPKLADLEMALTAFDQLLRDRVQYVLVLDVSDMGIIAAALRHRAARWLIENGTDVVKYCVGVVCVATHPLARAIIDHAQKLGVAPAAALDTQLARIRTSRGWG